MRKLVLILLLSGCVQASIDIPRICDSGTITFPAVAMNPGIHIPPITRSFLFSAGLEKSWFSQLLLLEGQIDRMGGGDFSFLDEMIVSIDNPSGGYPLVIMDSKDNNMSVLHISASTTNLVDYMDDNNQFTINITIDTQQPPMKDWIIDASLCASAKIDQSIKL